MHHRWDTEHYEEVIAIPKSFEMMDLLTAQENLEGYIKSANGFGQLVKKVNGTAPRWFGSLKVIPF